MGRSLIECDNFVEYVDLLKNGLSHYILLIGVKDTIGLNFTDANLNTLKSIGIKENLVGKHQYSYIALIQGGISCFEKLDSIEIEYAMQIPFKMYVSSAGYTVGNKSVIEVNNVNYSVNRRGLNMVIYDTNCASVIDSVCFDFHLKSTKVSHKPVNILGLCVDMYDKVSTTNSSVVEMWKKVNLYINKMEIIVRALGNTRLDDGTLLIQDVFKNMPKATGDLRLIQQGLMILLVELDQICRQYGASYWLSYGSLLGAVRHNGFIPWDDDVDVSMLREDFEKIRNNDNLNSRISLKTLYVFTDSVPYKIYRLYFKNDLSLFLDIFVFDLGTVNPNSYEEYRKARKFIFDSVPSPYQRKTFSKDPQLNSKLDSAIKDATSMVTYLNDNGTSIIYGLDNHSTSLFYNYTYNYDDIFPLQEIEFEGHPMLCPRNADIVLRQSYSDYYTIPSDTYPKHGNILNDASRKLLQEEIYMSEGKK